MFWAPGLNVGWILMRAKWRDLRDGYGRWQKGEGEDVEKGRATKLGQGEAVNDNESMGSCKCGRCT